MLMYDVFGSAAYDTLISYVGTFSCQYKSKIHQFILLHIAFKAKASVKQMQKAFASHSAQSHLWAAN